MIGRTSLRRALKMRASLEELLKTIEGLRSEKQPEIRADLVVSIVETESTFVDRRADAVKSISDLLDESLETGGAE